MTLSIDAHDHGKIRVFRLSDALHRALGDVPDLAPLEQALGVVFAKTDDVQIIAAGSLTDMSLGQFLAAAYDVDSQALGQTQGLQGAANSNFAVIRSGAFGGAAVTLRESTDATQITTLDEGGPDAPSMAPLQSDSAKGSVAGRPAKPPKSDARIGGMIAMYVLLFLFALVGLMIWIAA